MSDNKSKRNIEAIYPLSPMQQGMLFHSLYAPESGAYFEQFSCVLKGHLDLAAFEAAWREVVKRQSVLRTAFVWKRLDKMLQVVQKDVDLPIEHQDWRVGKVRIEDRLQAYLDADRAKGFDLAKPPLMRLGLFRIADDRHYFVWSHHHALMDGWSMPLLLKEVLTFYEGYSQGKAAYLPPGRPYRDYISWLQEQDLVTAESYWRNLLKGIYAPTPLVVDRGNPELLQSGDRRPGTKRSEENGKSQVNRFESEFHLSKKITADLGKLARRERVTISTMIQAAWALLLSRYTGEGDVLFGATVSGRPAELSGAENMIGLFINTLPVRIRLNPHQPLVEWLQEIQQQSIETRQFEYSALVQIQDWSEIPHGAPLFESILVFENYPVEETVRSSMAAGQHLSIEQFNSYEQTNFPITIVSGPGEELGITVSYDPGRFDFDTISRLMGHLGVILESFSLEIDLAVGEQRKLKDIDLLTAAEEAQILSGFVNQYAITNEKFDQIIQNTPIHQLFERKAQETPNTIAVVLDEHGETLEPGKLDSIPDILSITYGELNKRADILATFLTNLGVGPEVLVGLYVERSLEMIIGMLGILKAGGAYLPLDPNYPKERIAFMIGDTQAPIILTQSHLQGDVRAICDDVWTGNPEEKNAWRVISLDSEWEHISSTRKLAHREGKPADESSLAYVIYTSGSTGKPKGVMVEHHSLTNLATNFAALTDLSSADRVLQFISLGFDASAEEIFPSLISGATLVLPRSSRELTTEDFINLVRRQSVTMLHLPAAFWHRCVDDMLASQEIPGSELTVPDKVRILVVGGENPSLEKLMTWINLSGQQPGKFINAYGPTESTIAAAYYKTDLDKKGIQSLERLPIGRGLVNNRIFILDPELRPAPVGIPGEIWIGGTGVARGYLNHPDTTAEKFIQTPLNLIPAFQSEEYSEVSSLKNSRLYRTGDLGRFLPDGNIEFIGRADQQVKIRGFRIELGEIETVLEQYPAIKTAAVLVHLESNTGEQRLVAYIVPTLTEGDQSIPILMTSDLSSSGSEIPDRPAMQLDLIEIRHFLQEYLPDYMIPSSIMVLSEMPLTPNGKIDRKALPVPDGITNLSPNVYIAPRSPVETLLVGIWEQILGVKKIGINDNFFDLGGHSLIATQVISRIRNVFQVELPLRTLFENPTAAGLAEQVENFIRTDHETTQLPFQHLPLSPESGLPIEPPQLSFSQQRLWFLDQLAPGNLFYSIPLAVEISGKLDVSALQQTIDEIVARHAILRTNFKSVGGIPLQIINPKLFINLPIIDLTSFPADERMAEARRLARQEAQIAFNLEKDALIRTTLINLGADSHTGLDHFVFLLTMHHIISDGWSMGIFLNEVSELYPAFSSCKPSPLPDLKYQYYDYSNWQRNWLQGERLERQLGYWKKQLANQPALLDLPTDRPRPAVQSSNGATKSFTISADLTNKINDLCRQENVTLFMTLLAVFNVLLSRYSGQEDISIGSAIANRNRSEVESLVGFFVNTLVLRTDLSGEPTFTELLNRVREVSLGAYAHQDLPFEMLVEALQPDRDLSHTPLFQVAFALQNAPISDSARRAVTDYSEVEDQKRLDFNLIEVDSSSAKFDLTLTLAETMDGLAGGLEYNSDLFDDETIERMITHFSILLEKLISDPGRKITRIEMLSQVEYQEMLRDWNSTVMETPIHRCAHHLVENWAEQMPEGAAVRFEDQTLSYAELNQRAELLANYLLKLGVKPDALVGVSIERSILMIIGILGVMKAGGAYVPLDPSYPAERLAYMIQDSKISVLLTTENLKNQLPVHNAGETSGSPLVVCLDSDWKVIEKTPVVQKEAYSSPENLAYMIYTSGSTGRPKGTMLRHRGLSNLAEAQRTAFNITPKSRVLQFSPLSFDASVWETFMALANGACLILARQEVLTSPPDLLNLLQVQQVTTITLPPSVLRLFSADQVSVSALPHLKTVISAGEACTPELIANWSHGRDFYNAYGPTETTVCATMYHCTGAETEQPPIGRPIANTKAYILDRYLQPVPVGVNGELYVSGISLAVGYFNQPELTAAKFIENPFAPMFDSGSLMKPGNLTMYKTGDLVRYRQDGNIDYLGRIDQQVKVRGFRIELGEIETAFGKHPQVKEAVVITQNGDHQDKRLAAFVVAQTGAEIDFNELRGFLRQSLPEYMLPSSIAFLDEFPLTPSGKVDRKALQALQTIDRPELANAYVPPRDPIEQRLAEICGDLLHLEKIGIYDNFFELGGHSLLATQFVSRVRDEYGIELQLRKLFENPTIVAIADIIRSEQQNRAEQERSGAAAGGKTLDRAKLLEMLQKVGGLSEDEVKALLEQKKRLDKSS